MGKTTILVVEDDLHLMEGIRDILQINGYDVLTATNGVAGLDVLKAQPAPRDLIVSDIMMPRMDGYEFFNAVRSVESWVAIPFIFLTAKGEREDIKRGKRMGAEDYVVKPFDADDLLVAVSAKLNRKKQLDEVWQSEMSGIKHNILCVLVQCGARVTVFPPDVSAEQVLAAEPDGVLLSNGPGDPAGLPYLVETVKELLDSGVPLFGICLGHQLIGRALGADTCRLKFGHHGGNHPVQHLPTGRVLITAQNHNYCVIPEQLDPAMVEVTYRSLNDNSLEGMRLKNQPAFSVQFHPEAAPGPHDAHDIFGEFFALINKGDSHA